LIDLLDISEAEKNQLNEWTGYFSHQITGIFTQFIKRPEKVICMFTGNQKGKGADVSKSYVMRILGIHPVEKKNLRPNNPIRTIRFASETLPNDPEGGEVKNTQYPAIKKWLPPSLLKKDITIRKPVMTIRDPQGGPDIYIEFVSYNQDVQAMAGVQRFSVWCDESAPKVFYEEQLPRLLAADGDLIYTLTPAEFMGWEFDELFEQGHIYIRTKAVCDRIYQRTGKRVPMIQTTDSTRDIAVIMAATDDNPILDSRVINEMFSLYDDEDIIDIRRYGIFKQVSGQIFKDFDLRVHRIDGDKYFPNGILPQNWMMGRFIDYHEHNAWAILFMALSPYNECFIFDEMNPSPEKMVTLDIARQIAYKSRDYHFPLNLADPLAAKKQPNTGMSVIDDLNRIFYQFRKDNLGTGGYWQSWDTKSTRGRDEIRKRLKNSKLAGKPFNNVQTVNGLKTYLPTLWITDNCKQTLLSFKNWRKEEWSDREVLMTKEEKDKPQQKWSHFPMCAEAAFKHIGFRPKRIPEFNEPVRRKTQREYFKSRVA